MLKKGSFFRILSAILGASTFLIAVYFLNKDDILQSAIFGVIGILLVTIATFPFLKR
jgi:hypothetical protein